MARRWLWGLALGSLGLTGCPADSPGTAVAPATSAAIQKAAALAVPGRFLRWYQLHQTRLTPLYQQQLCHPMPSPPATTPYLDELRASGYLTLAYLARCQAAYATVPASAAAILPADFDPVLNLRAQWLPGLLQQPSRLLPAKPSGSLSQELAGTLRSEASPEVEVEIGKLRFTLVFSHSAWYINDIHSGFSRQLAE